MIHKPPTHRPALAVKTGLKAGYCEPPECTMCESETSFQNCRVAETGCQPPDCNCSSEDTYLACLIA